MDLLRTPDERFAALDDYPFNPHHLDPNRLLLTIFGGVEVTAGDEVGRS